MRKGVMVAKCPCGSPATRVYMAGRCCDRCYELDKAFHTDYVASHGRTRVVKSIHEQKEERWVHQTRFLVCKKYRELCERRGWTHMLETIAE